MSKKKNVKYFYDHVGWQTGGGEGVFVDALKFEDLRPVSRDYIYKCHMRVNRYLKPNGKFILDVASGPIQYPEYLTYSSNFDIRMCVDISFVALKEARKKLGDKGIYLLADITNLPLKDNLIDAVVSLHTIYHVPENEQSKAFHEIFRVLKPGTSAVIVYSWGIHSYFMKVMLSPFYIIRAPLKLFRVFKIFIRKKLTQRKNLKSEKSSEDSRPKLYFHAHNYRWFKKNLGFEFDILVWRSVSVPFLKTYIRSFFGKQVLALIYWLEEIFPHIAGRLGHYPMFVIKK